MPDFSKFSFVFELQPLQVRIYPLIQTINTERAYTEGIRSARIRREYGARVYGGNTERAYTEGIRSARIRREHGAREK